jgi:hypothetical protein
MLKESFASERTLLEAKSTAGDNAPQAARRRQEHAHPDLLPSSGGKA